MEASTKRFIKAAESCFTWSILFMALTVFFSGTVHASDGDGAANLSPGKAWNTVRLDYEQFYTRYRLVRLMLAYGLGDIAANTDADQHLQDWYQDHVRSSGTDRASTIAKNFGNGWYIVPLTVASAALGTYVLPRGEAGSALGTWGGRSLRAILVGGPAVVVMRSVTGASRPSENNGSQWRPFKSTHGVSGHAFIGAIPFLTLARMYEDYWYVKYPLYLASTLTAISRINDNQHFPSQAALGWYMAWEATDSIAERDSGGRKVKILPILGYNTYGLQVYIEW
ncbi:MAG TPA: phosphatase PAP2 family protein [Desulfomonilia bacterium]|nr:phosphatase PAP2 family protein [Desulfomonilia bacterium]